MAHVRLFRHYIHIPFIILGLVDFIVLACAFALAVFFRFFGNLNFFVDSLNFVAPSALVFAGFNLLVMMALGVHQSRVDEGLSGMMLRTIMALILSIPLSLTAFLIATDWLWYLGGDGVITAASVFGFFLLGIFRTVFFTIVGGDAFKRDILVLGAGFRAKQLLEDLRTPFNRKGFNLVGFVPLPHEPVEVPAQHLINLPESLHRYILDKPVREIVVAVDDRRKGLPMEDLLECKMEGVNIVDGAAFYERESRKVALEMITHGWLVFSDGFTVSTVSGLGKRALDILTSAILLLAASPLMLLTVLAIKLEDGLAAPVLYSQERVGLNGHVFKVHKFRSMRPDAEKGGAVWAQKNDTRVTRVGEFIRKVRIDELPQIFNVLNGTMAFVGPRPERPMFVEQLAEKIPFYNERHRVKPGITGWAQLCFAYADNEEDSREKLRYDLYYIKNQSLLLDLLIIIQTVEVVLFKKGSR
ncbi:TIGR03013 family PEP-CTERM/XrtA system glycosyltransferase [Marinobacter nanhaiticus D15-8W]|uniref:TIGR03013 family PEP-CTERM/XrtA system glycosyltransferase n=1 Tax=Marinobacter nanhaiticus D15-8W TaxID=626887 RepID=N6WRZ7_9GAMM|nr:TIGR03013 family XrtA/PEP-CTERM system glycosyltransferase [Marinobacter nanhaiticus]ENO14316.1 TIGR03013 family PEP-CTERM/XrtA system glycosyltransferase [Marinobacter nanhaiticus D15-8W]BES71703.1 TIGR03013 family PEP-CTERM/XrtA system glycosyltransferase [Marinobacter nanhaiticus D15-8W]